MQTHLHGRDMITTQEWTKDELNTINDVALDLKRRRALGEEHSLLRDKVLAMLFFFSSTRTRASFEAGMAQLGGHAMFLDSTSTQIGHARCVAYWVDALRWLTTDPDQWSAVCRVESILQNEN